MKTIEIQIYKFDELSESAKQNAINEYRKNDSYDFIYSDAENTVKAFCNAFNVKTSYRSWLDCNTSNIEDDILNLTGLRLRKYLINNFGSTLYKRKYLKIGKVTEAKKPFHPMRKNNEIKHGLNKGKFYTSYYSNFSNLGNDCNLTGMCYDCDIMQPIYDFLELRSFDNTNFEDILNDCFDAMRKTIDNEIDYRYTEEFIIEEIKANDYDFTVDGQIY